MIFIKVHLHFLDILGDNLRAFCPLFFQLFRASSDTFVSIRINTYVSIAQL